MKKLTILLFSILISFSPYSFGEIIYSDYERWKSSPETETLINSYISGAEAGFGWANTLLESKEQKPLFCQPRKLSLNIQTTKDIIKEKVKNLLKLGLTQEEIDKYPVPLILIKGLIDTFPCK